MLLPDVQYVMRHVATRCTICNATCCYQMYVWNRSTHLARCEAVNKDDEISEILSLSIPQTLQKCTSLAKTSWKLSQDKPMRKKLEICPDDRTIWLWTDVTFLKNELSLRLMFVQERVGCERYTTLPDNELVVGWYHVSSKRVWLWTDAILKSRIWL